MIMNNKKEYQLGEVFHWGKHKGVHVETVILTDPAYIQWCLDNIPEFCLSEGAKRALNDRLREDLTISQTLNN